MIKKKNESGRSMVEMLGVLAIIGVLSIGGIAGYTMSMRRHRANMILDAANKYALVVYGACHQAFMNGDIEDIMHCRPTHVPTLENSDIGHVADAEIGYSSIGRSSTTGDEFIMISVDFRDQAVCKAAKSMVKHEQNPGCTGASSHPFFPLDIRFQQN